MTVDILPFGNNGTTRKVADMLAKQLDCANVIEDEKQLSGDICVLGTNVRFGKFNKRFRKAAKKLSKSDKKLFVYICGAEIEKSEHYIDAARQLFPSALDIKYVWGELDLSSASSRSDKFFIETFIGGRKKDGLPKPRLLDKEIRSLSREIKEASE